MNNIKDFLVMNKVAKAPIQTKKKRNRIYI